MSKDIGVSIDSSFGYRILNFVTVFSAISTVVKCKTCHGDVSFEEASIRGLGFKLMVLCDSCESTSVNSSPLIGDKAYDINRRIIFAFRLLRIGLTGIKKFCGIMDLPRPVPVLNNIHCAAEAVCKMSMQKAIKEEKEIAEEKGKGPRLTISEHGTWQKHGFSPLFVVSTLIGYYSGKVLDVIVCLRIVMFVYIGKHYWTCGIRYLDNNSCG